MKTMTRKSDLTEAASAIMTVLKLSGAYIPSSATPKQGILSDAAYRTYLPDATVMESLDLLIQRKQVAEDLKNRLYIVEGATGALEDVIDKNRLKESSCLEWNDMGRYCYESYLPKQGGRATIMARHDIGMADIYDWNVFANSGRKEEAGTTQTLQEAQEAVEDSPFVKRVIREQLTVEAGAQDAIEAVFRILGFPETDVPENKLLKAIIERFEFEGLETTGDNLLLAKRMIAEARAKLSEAGHVSGLLQDLVEKGEIFVGPGKGAEIEELQKLATEAGIEIEITAKDPGAGGGWRVKIV